VLLVPDEPWLEMLDDELDELGDEDDLEDEVELDCEDELEGLEDEEGRDDEDPVLLELLLPDAPLVLETLDPIDPLADDDELPLVSEPEEMMEILVVLVWAWLEELEEEERLLVDTPFDVLVPPSQP
jgi:hypothetical protein